MLFQNPILIKPDGLTPPVKALQKAFTDASDYLHVPAHFPYTTIADQKKIIHYLNDNLLNNPGDLSTADNLSISCSFFIATVRGTSNAFYY